MPILFGYVLLPARIVSVSPFLQVKTLFVCRAQSKAERRKELEKKFLETGSSFAAHQVCDVVRLVSGILWACRRVRLRNCSPVYHHCVLSESPCLISVLAAGTFTLVSGAVKVCPGCKGYLTYRYFIQQ